MDKVYCDDCKYYVPEIIYPSIPKEEEKCLAEENRSYPNKHLHHTYNTIKKPAQLNKNNDCNWFIERLKLGSITKLERSME